MDAQTITILISLLGVLAGFILFYWGKRLERQSVNKATLAEISRLIDVISRHKDYYSKPGNRDLPLIPFSTPIYNEQAKNIGLLDNSIVANVVEFYGYVQFLNSLQMTKAGYTTDKLPLFEEMYLRSLETFINTHSSVFDKAFRRYGVSGS
jgi:hypothetical protein